MLHIKRAVRHLSQVPSYVDCKVKGLCRAKRNRAQSNLSRCNVSRCCPVLTTPKVSRKVMPKLSKKYSCRFFAPTSLAVVSTSPFSFFSFFLLADEGRKLHEFCMVPYFIWNVERCLAVFPSVCGRVYWGRVCILSRLLACVLANSRFNFFSVGNERVERGGSAGQSNPVK